MNQSLISLFYKSMEPQLESGSKSHTFKPSSLGSKCLRRIYYSYFRTPKDFDVDESVKKMGKLGTGVHEIFSDAFRSSGSLIDYVNPDGTFNTKGSVPNLEFPIEVPELFIKRGYIDAVLIIDGELWIGEYKSCTAKSFATLKAPKDDHLIQASLYFAVFNRMLKQGHFKHIKQLDGFDKAKGLRFLYVDRDNIVRFPLKEFVVSEDICNKVFENTVHKILATKQHIDAKALPAKTKEWCNSCEYRTKCSKNFNFD